MLVRLFGLHWVLELPVGPVVLPRGSAVEPADGFKVVPSPRTDCCIVLGYRIIIYLILKIRLDKPSERSCENIPSYKIGRPGYGK
jgi:hypothetical protein